jgi:ribosomal protein S18 acetylase RimI-like enzyme
MRPASVTIHAARADDGADEIAIRAATLHDLDVVVELRLALLREEPDHPIYGRLRPDAEKRARDLFAKQLRSIEETIYLAIIRDEIVGILRCTEATGSALLEPGRYAYVSSAYVRPAARRRGVLRALMTAAERWARLRGLGEMRLHNVAGSSNAESSWTALGFDVMEQVRMRPVTRKER